VSRSNIKDNDYSLSPGRYVGTGVSVKKDDDNEIFVGRMREIHSDLAELSHQALGLTQRVQLVLSEFLE